MLSICVVQVGKDHMLEDEVSIATCTSCCAAVLLQPRTHILAMLQDIVQIVKRV